MALDKFVDSTQLDADLTSVANAIRNKSGGSGTLAFPSGFINEINAISTGGGSSPSPVISGYAVRFIDYDGSIIASYSVADALALTELPANPSHTGLTAQGWNWSLTDIKAYLTKYPNGIVNVGQMYTTDDGKTRIYIYIDDDTPANRMTFYVRFTASVANNTTIDWGDGISEVKGGSATNYPHTYASPGNYTITLTVNSGVISFVGGSETNGSSIYGFRAIAYSYNRGRIRKIEIGNNVSSIGTYAFYYCYSLASVTIPSSVTSIGTYAFHSCNSLTSITIPSSVTSIRTYAFYYCYSLTSIAIPAGITSIGSYAFSSCHSLTSITIPDDVTSIENNAFTTCYSLISIAIPSRITSIGVYMLSGCYGLTSVTIPDDVTSIGNFAFQTCYGLTTITVPDNVTNIGSSAFANCCGVGKYHLLPNTPPTLSSTNAFNNIASDCVIYVPYSEDHSILTAYQNATNWSNYASKMQEESQ